jgi:hypothetical protein
MRRAKVRPLRTQLVLVILVSQLSWGTVPVLANVCRGHNPPDDPYNLPTDGYVAADGKHHIRVDLTDSQDDGTMHDLIQQAFGEWNNHSSSTNVVFEWGTPADINFGRTDDLAYAKGCAAHHSNNDDIAYCDDVAIAAGESPENTKHVLEHELAHYLGLDDDNSSDGIAHQLLPGSNSCLDAILNYAPNDWGIKSDDANYIGVCEGAFSHGTVNNDPYDDYYDYWDPNQEDYICHVWQRVTRFYTCTDSCSLYSTSTETMDVWCEPFVI